MSRTPFVKWILALFMSLGLLSAQAHETDQFSLPVGRDFADFGPFLSEFFYGAIERGVNNVNARARQNPQANISADEVTRAVNAEFPYAIWFIQDLDHKITGGELSARTPGYLPGFMPPASIHKFFLFPLNPMRAWNCATVKAYGVYFGTDKIGHFTDMGMHYWNGYKAALASGMSEADAVKAAIQIGIDDPTRGESRLIGYWTAGAYSNADLVSNYAGFLFYRNLTEPQRLKGVPRPPMLVRDGPGWKIAPHVRPDSDFFHWFVSDHWDEAINPSHYLPQMREGVRGFLRDNLTNVLEHRRDRFGSRRSERSFYDQSVTLRTYYGDWYGHRGSDSELVMIDQVMSESRGNDGGRDRIGRTLLHVFAAIGDVQQLQGLLSEQADVNVPVRSDEVRNSDWGNTPLHAAVSSGQVEAVRLLLGRGADVNRANDRGMTPLHLAVDDPVIANFLLSAGANVNASDAQGRTPLHLAAMDSRQRTLKTLLARGASLLAPDRDGQQPLHYAARAGNAAAADTLVANGADPDAMDDFGFSALHLASRTGHDAIARALRRYGATPARHQLPEAN